MVPFVREQIEKHLDSAKPAGKMGLLMGRKEEVEVSNTTLLAGLTPILDYLSSTIQVLLAEMSATMAKNMLKLMWKMVLREVRFCVVVFFLSWLVF